MPNVLGRISGPLLKDNLLRDGVDLAFETDLLYLDVDDGTGNGRIGIKTTTPQYDLDVNGTTRTTNLIVDTQANIADFTITDNTITSSTNVINFIPTSGQTVVYHSSVEINDISISGNTISTLVSNANLELKTNGNGIVDIYSDTKINGNLEVVGSVNVTGDVRINGNITIGDSLSDSIQINAAINSDLVPQGDNAYDLGSEDNAWAYVYSRNFVTDNLSVDTLNMGDIEVRDNEISAVNGTDLVLYGQGTGGVVLGNFKFRSNTITNISNNAISQLLSSGNGYFKISGTNGFVMPRGSNAERPTAYAVLGMTRYNTENRALEVWDGFTWASPAGSLGAISEATANDISVAYALMLG